MRTWPNPNIPHQFFRIMDNEVPLTVGACGHFFEQDEYEMVRASSLGLGLVTAFHVADSHAEACVWPLPGKDTHCCMLCIAHAGGFAWG